ncbi:MAG: isoprenylcysteine carboxylmethyltransferase family protein [Desulfobulbaceae bacterium]
MKSVIAFYLRFTGKEYSALYKALSMVPGFLVFLVISPFIVFQVSSFLSRFVPLPVPRFVELAVSLAALVFAIVLMTWALVELWTKGEGTPAPITPTRKLVTTGPYRWGRNPIELGTNIYFLVVGTFFDNLVTGVLCMVFGLLLGTAYIKGIEEKEMLLRFGKPYEIYLRTVPFMSVPGFSWLRREGRA